MKSNIKKFKLIFLIFICFSIITLNFNIYAGDMLFHFMQAHQDYLVIGQITEKNENMYKITVTELIKTSSIREDIPKEIEVELDNYNFKKGDNIAISLSKRGGGYKLENGVYQVTTSSTDDLEVVNLNNANLEAEYTAIELFLKSRGKIKEFYFTNGEVYVYNESGITTSEDICIYTKENGKMLPVEFEKNEKYLIEEKKIDIKIIILFILLFIVVQIIVLVIYLKMIKKQDLKSIFNKSEVEKNKENASN